MTLPEMTRQEGVAQFREVAKSWLCWSMAYNFLHIVVGVGAVTFSAAIASNYQILPLMGAHQPLDSEKFLNVIFSSLITFFSAKDVSLRYMRAHHRLKVALAKFDSEDDYPKFGLGQAYDDGASIIDQYPKTDEKADHQSGRGAA
jgi:hypothetical protein